MLCVCSQVRLPSGGRHVIGEGQMSPINLFKKSALFAYKRVRSD